MDRTVDHAAVPAAQNYTNAAILASELRPSGGPTLAEQELLDDVREIAQERDEARAEVLQLRAALAEANARQVFLSITITELRASQSAPAGPVVLELAA